jgi:hypothetical protein
MSSKNWKKNDGFNAAESVREDGARVFAVYKLPSCVSGKLKGRIWYWDLFVPGLGVRNIAACSRKDAIEYADEFFPAK